MPEPKKKTGIERLNPADDLESTRALLQDMLKRATRPLNFDAWMEITGGDERLATVMSALERQFGGQHGSPMTRDEAQRYMKSYAGEWRQPPQEATRPPTMVQEPAPPEPDPLYSSPNAHRAMPFAGASSPFGEVSPMPKGYWSSDLGREEEQYLTRPLLPDAQLDPVPTSSPEAARMRFGPGER